MIRAPRHEYVDVIVLDSLVGRIGVVSQRGSDSVDLVRRDACPDPTSADDHATIGLTGHQGSGDPVRRSRDNRPLGRIRSQVQSLVTAVDQGLNNGGFQRKARVVGADRESHGVVPSWRVASITRHSTALSTILASAGFLRRATMPLVNPPTPEAISSADLSRDFTVATFVVNGDPVLLLWHRSFRCGCRPGGHVRPNELPDDAAVRGSRRGGGCRGQLVGDHGVGVDDPRRLVRPEGIQLERIRPGHEHIDLIYFARPVDPARSTATRNDESEAIGWFTRPEMVGRGVTTGSAGLGRSRVRGARRLSRPKW